MSKVDIVAEALRDRIGSNEFGLSGGLPPKSLLAETYGVSLDTIKRALDQLQQEGLVAQRGKGYHVDRVERIIRNNSQVTSFANTLQQQGHTPKGRSIIDPHVATIPDIIASLCGLSPETKAAHRSYVRGTDQRMYEIAEFWYSVDEAAQFLQAMSQDPEGNFLDEIMRLRGVPRITAEEMVFCRHATSDEAAHLKISKNAYVLESLIKCYEASGQTLVIMKIVSIHAVVHRYVYPYALE